MLYCSHCGFEFDNKKFEQKNSTHQMYMENIDGDTEVSYICPRCGHLIHENFDEEDTKSLSRACHAELQRGRNSFARGMSSISIGVILAAISAIFFALSNKISDGGGKRITITAPEFWVGAALALISVSLLVLGVVKTVQGLNKKKQYSTLLKDINNGTFVQ